MEQRLRALDGLRGIAALVVVANHILLLSPTLARASYGHAEGRLAGLLVDSPLSILWGGTEAVWIFFILSGYVLTRRHFAGATLRAGNYYWRRATRLYVPMAGSVLLALVLRAVPHTRVIDGSWWMNAHSRGTNVSEVLGALVLLSGNHSPLNSVWWSLQWEAWFSILLPVVVLLCKPVRRHLWIFGLVCLFVACWGPPQRRVFPPDAWYHAIEYMPMFGIGIALAAYEPAIRRIGWFRHAAVGWAAVLGALALFWSHSYLSDIQSSLPLTRLQLVMLSRATTLVAAASFLVLALSFGQLASALTWRPIEWVGLRSYSLYLVHEPIVVSLGFGLHLTSLTWWFVLLALGLSLATTEVFYRAVEVRSMRIGRWHLRRSPALA